MDAWTNQSGVIKIIALPLQKGKSYEIKLEHYDLRRTAQIVFGWRKKPSPLELEPVRLASTANAAIVCVGFNSQTESEGRDRTFALPSDQEELIKEVAKVNKNTIVVITAGGNIAMTGWINNIAGLLHSWYSGQEGGTAIAEILFGDINPSGKLPISCEKKWEDNPCYPYYYDTDNDRKTEYTEGVFIGYRYYDTKNVEPLFPFGFGLSYTTFKYKNLTVSPAQITANQKVTVSLDVTNTGTRAGAEAVQLYIRDNVSSIPRPAKELKAFDKVLLKPGETKRVTFTLDVTALSFYSVERKGWVAEPGEFEVQVGSSSRDIRLKKVFTLK
jgi:beta-glucosidase